MVFLLRAFEVDVCVLNSCGNLTVQYGVLAFLSAHCANAWRHCVYVCLREAFK